MSSSKTTMFCRRGQPHAEAFHVRLKNAVLAVGWMFVDNNEFDTVEQPDPLEIACGRVPGDRADSQEKYSRSGRRNPMPGSMTDSSSGSFGPVQVCSTDFLGAEDPGDRQHRPEP